MVCHLFPHAVSSFGSDCTYIKSAPGALVDLRRGDIDKEKDNLPARPARDRPEPVLTARGQLRGQSEMKIASLDGRGLCQFAGADFRLQDERHNPRLLGDLQKQWNRRYRALSFRCGRGLVARE